MPSKRWLNDGDVHTRHPEHDSFRENNGGFRTFFQLFDPAGGVLAAVKDPLDRRESESSGLHRKKLHAVLSVNFYLRSFLSISLLLYICEKKIFFVHIRAICLEL